MTKKPFVGQSKLANGLLDLIHTKRLWTTENSGQRWVLLFHNIYDDHSRYSYVYLMRYKSEAFVRFKEFRLDLENQTASQWPPPGTHQLNDVAERRNRTLLDMIRSTMSFTKLPLSFWGYALETAARLLNIVLSKTVAQTQFLRVLFYDPTEQKVFVSRNAVFLERGFPTDTRRDELLLEESSQLECHSLLRSMVFRRDRSVGQ
ncbi:UNVERIFIED_CONTAM: hypothetical protein Sangu_2793200 [Sesamum angustifolium]|uniref:Integrase catalytic domain-containing protein n=1 Tax=Sesamum angustifolium TaxID=2727405 RepID=A0AAW2ISV2_9LAMI